MISPFQRWAAALAIACSLGAGLAEGARAAEDDTPIDAVPLIRPQMPSRGLAPSEEPLPAPEAPTPAPAEEMPQAAEPAPMTGETATGVAALPAPEAAILRIHFEPDDATLSQQMQAAIQTFATNFKTRGGRVALKAYAGKAGDTSSNARRLSLKRVLAVRQQLLAQGIAAERLQVRALGGVRDAGPADRVDIVKSGS
jgi:outer membrane protein OmpA-like peptidoglycan-associated protein